ncbi:hypothetical protein QR680_010259 [Steinernema hermaphroditum]|uniref:Uncharacterized protein n=1 Tax=Steinernema hermaphroditum TaxID=289476 RepID=A0AA39MAX5_9BILA|nr:hypothetical protein QR680_010259 [Steinernema hermaphroditum]
MSSLRLLSLAVLCFWVVYGAPRINGATNTSVVLLEKNATDVDGEKMDTLLYAILNNVTESEPPPHLKLEPTRTATNESDSRSAKQRNDKNKGILTYIAFGIAFFISISTLTFYAWESFCKKKPAHFASK